MSADFPSSLILVGAGKMGGAMLEGWLHAGLYGPSVTVIDPLPPDAMSALCARVGAKLNPKETPSIPEALVLGIKPQMFDAAAPTLAPLAGPDTLVVSILAGKTIDNLKTRLPNVRAIVRSMPNLPASVGRGISGAAASPEVTERQKLMADRLLKGVGQVEWVDHEDLIDAITGLSGSGPAYVFHLVECLAKAGEAEGLPPDLSMRLARATVEGAGELLHRSDLSAEMLRQNVTSPGGTTAAGLTVLMGNKALEKLIAGTVHAARRRAHELSG